MLVPKAHILYAFFALRLEVCYFFIPLRAQPVSRAAALAVAPPALSLSFPIVVQHRILPASLPMSHSRLCALL